MANTPRKTDRRAKRTRAALRAALIQLLDEKTYESITVEELVAVAELSRATFYFHYRDKDDLLLEVISFHVQEQLALVAQNPIQLRQIYAAIDNDSGQAQEQMRMIFQHVRDHNLLYRAALSGEGAPRLADQLRQMLIQGVNTYIRMRLESGEGQAQLLAPVELMAGYFVGALQGTVCWWLETDMLLPPDEIAWHFQRLFYSGVRRVVRLVNFTPDVPVGRKVK
jgi:AcrR family transcriptional regulator